MTNRSRLVSGRVPTSNSANVTSDRYQFLDLSSAEPNLGAANTGDILSYNSNYPGGRQWISANTLVAGNTQQIFDKANSANVLAQAAYNQANSASANTIVLAAVDVAQNVNISIALAGVEAANSNISFLTGFSQGAYNKANAANVLAQAAFDKANLAASSTYTQAAYDKANSANVLAQSAYDNSNTKFSSTGGNITGDVTIINNKNLTVTGNLTVQGNLISTNTQSFTVADPLILLGLGNYTSDLKDIGFVSHYNDGVNAHAGFFRDSTTKDWYLFKGYVPEVDANNNIIITDPTFRTDNLVASIVKANLVGTTAVVNNIELGGFTQAAYNFANSANSLAQAAYNAANAAGSSTYVQGAYNQANSANVLAQAAYNQANTAGANTIVLAAGNVAQNANIAIALAGLTAANANIAIAQAGVVAANSNISYLINTFVPAAYNAANTAQLQALGAFGFAQASYNQANSALGIALSAGIQANVANSIANTALQNTASIVTAGNLTVSNNLTVTNNVTAAYITTTGIGGSISGANTISANTLNVLNAIVTSNTASTSNTTGALLVTGGVGVQGNLYATAVYSNNQIVLTSEPIGQNAFNKANAANVLAQAAFDYANSASGGALAAAAFNKANSANVLAQAAFNAANAAVQTTGGTITGTLNVANIIETGKTITVAANTSWNTNSQLANSGIVVGNLTYKSNSVYFDGTEDSLTLSPGVTVGANEYTIEFWMYLLDANINTPLGIVGTNTTNAFNLRLNSNTQIQIDKSFAGSQLFTVPTIQSGTWYHIAAVRDVSSRATVFINGVRSSTGYVTDSLNYSGPTNSIASTISTANYSPYLSNIRIVTNNTLYDPTQSSITVPTSILGTVTGTQYLGAQYAATYDASGNQTVTVNADARTEGFSPFYNQPAISLLYDGANNWLTYGGITAAAFNSNGINVLNFAKAAFDFANSAAGGSSVDSYARIVANSTAIVANIVGAGLVATNTNTAIALAGVQAANSNISFLTGFSQSAYTTANTTATVANSTAVVANIVAAGLVATNTNTAIALAGVVAANSNISFLTGFSQGAYDKANTTATVANSTAVVANIVAAGLVATNTNTAIALAGVEAANSNISFLTGFSQGAYDKANSANVLAQYAANKANTSLQLSGSSQTVSSNVTIQGDLSVTGNVVYTGNVTSISVTGNTGQFFGYASNGFNALYAGIPTGYRIEPQSTFQVTGNFDGYSGINMQNINSGQNASADLFITADNGTTLDSFLDLGLASSNYDYTGYSLIGRNDGYLFVTGNTTTGGGSMVIGTGGPNDVIFATGGLESQHEVMRITSNNNVIIKNANLIVHGTNVTSVLQDSYNKANSASANTIVTQAIDVSQNANIAIALAGVQAANSNISFLTGFSQGAFNTANTTATVANSTAAVANIVAAGLVATNTNTAIALAGVAAANSNISFLTGFSQGAYNKANAALPNTGSLITVNSVSQVYISNTSPTALTVAGGANIVGNLITSHVTSSGNLLPSINNTYFLGNPSQRWHSLYVGPGSVDIGGIVLGNTGGALSISASDIQIIPPAGQAPLPSFSYTANVANSAQANTIVTQAVDVSQNANIAIALAGVAAANANIIALYAGNVSQNANIAIALAGVAAANSNISFLTGFSQGAYDKANAAYNYANSISTVSTFTQGAYDKANGAYDKANSANVLAQSAFDNSNTKFSSSGGNITGDVSIINNKNLLVTGNLTVLGNLVTTNTQQFTVADPLILLGTGNYYTDVLDIGFASHYNDGVNAHAGLVRDYGTKEWYLFKGYTPELDGVNQLDITDPSFRTANLNADIVRGNLIGTTAVVNNIELGGFTQAVYRASNVVASGLVATNSNVYIALAGVQAANSNISFLTGFSQGAFNTANTTATVANSTAVVANIVAAGLVATNTNVAIALAGVAAANSNISFLTGFSQGAYDKANTTATVANSTAIVANIVAAGLVATNTNAAIALAGVQAANANINITLAGVAAANSNISFLTGFSQGAYDKANTTATVANSTAVVANIVAAGLVATNTNTAIALAGVTAANSNISFLTGFSQSAYDRANIVAAGLVATNTNTAIALAGVQAANSNISFLTGFSQSAYDTANIVAAGLVATNTNTAIALAGVQAANSNISFLTGFSQGAYDKANASYNYANSLASGITSFTQGAYDKANSANVLAQASYNQANIASIVANSTSVVANIVAAGLVATNTNTAIALAGVVAANANISFLTGFSQGAFNTANTTATVANSTAVVANIVVAGLVATNTNTAIALAGLSAANANINFLTGFSQGAYDKANTTATVANSTSVVANIVAAGLVATNTNTAIALAGVQAANSNIGFLTAFSQGAYDKANTTATVANSTAFVANTKVTYNGWTPNTLVFANAAGYLSNVSNLQFNSSNSSLYVNGLTNLNYTGFAGSQNAALVVSGSNTKGGIGYVDFLQVTNQSGNGVTNPSKYFRLDNSGTLQIINSDYTDNIFQVTNSGDLTVPQKIQGNYIQFGDGSKQYTANAGSGGGGVSSQDAFNKANSANVLAQAAYNWANAAYDYANTIISGGGSDTYARDKANSANVLAQYAADKANAAFNYANTISGGNSVDSYARIVANSTAIVANIVAAGLVSTNTNTAIAFAGVAAANSNISFLTGFSQSAYDKANSASGGNLAQAAFDKANVVAAGLVSTNTNTAIALAGVEAANSNINFLTAFSQGAYDKANTTATVANSTAVVANVVVAGLVATNTNVAIALAGVQAANANINIALAGVQAANANLVILQSGLDTANANISFLIGFSQGAYDKANTGGGGSSQAAFDKANGAYDKANSANVLAQAAFDKANTGSGLSVTTAPTPPSSGNVAGAQWYNTDNDTLYEYTTSDGVYYYWIDIVSPAYSSNAITITGVSSGKAIAYALIFGG